jgi:lipopolysaccharide/colanic/teichoic acid biosynthesis glycosyltransferase
MAHPDAQPVSKQLIMNNNFHPESAQLNYSTEVPRWKRILDISLIVMTLPLWLPFFILIGLLIRLVSEGPILFRQERVGHLGKTFTCFKFRTMFMGNSAVSHQDHLRHLMGSNLPMEKLDLAGDPRIIPFGRLLRASGLDELPQIINVLRGEMSLVGPRPCLPYEYNQYHACQKERLNALPGLTGLWQVSGKNKTTFAEMIRLDIQYARTQNLAQDLIILGLTFPALIDQVGELRKRSSTPLRQAQSKAILVPSSLNAQLLDPRR